MLFALIGAASETIAQAPVNPAPQHLPPNAAALLERLARENEETRQAAKRLGIPERLTLDKGRTVYLREIDQGAPIYVGTMNTVAADTISTDEVQPGAGNVISLTGNGQTIGMWDGGSVYATHNEFMVGIVSSVVNLETATLSEHATHVAGTLIADGDNTAARGMAPDATIRAYHLQNDIAEMTTEAGAAANPMRLSNHSYGAVQGWFGIAIDQNNVQYPIWWGSIVDGAKDFKFGWYGAHARNLDLTANNFPQYLTVQAAGNSRVGPLQNGAFPAGNVWYYAVETDELRFGNHPGHNAYDTMNTNASAKNILTVGSVGDVTGGFPNSPVTSSIFSSWGPTDDGRIKPDIVANGEELFSTATNGGYQQTGWSGTSMAAPGVTGSIALLRQQWQNLNGTEPPSASMLKGLVLHTADDSGAAGPDYKFGWGLMNTESAANLIGLDSLHDGNFNLREVALSNGQEVLIQIFCPGGSLPVPLRVTAAWNDPAHAAVAGGIIDSPDRMLVNDLDLRLISPNAVTHTPFILDPANPANAATTGDNDRDNVEQVVVASPVAGVYTIRVSHKGTLTGGTQAVSLSISGATWLSQQGLTSATANSVVVSMASGADGSTLSSVTTNDNNVWSSRVVKIDAGGRELWSYTVPSGVYPEKLCYDALGNCVVVGRGAGTGGQSQWVLKLDANGGFLWERIGSVGALYAVDIDSANNIVVAGDISVPAASGLKDAYVEKLAAADGSALWANSWDYPVGKYNRNSHVVVDANDAVIVGGQTSPYAGNNSSDVLCRKYSAAGGSIWIRQINGPSGYGDEILDMTLDSLNNVIMCGRSETSTTDSSQRIMTLKVNGATGALTWLKRDTVNMGVGYAVCTDANDNVYTCGYSMPTTYGTRSTAISYNSAGTLRWTVRSAALPNPYADWADFRDITLSSNGRLFVVGSEAISGSARAIVKELNTANGASVRDWSYAAPTQSATGRLVESDQVSGSVRVMGKGGLGVASAFVVEYGP